MSREGALKEVSISQKNVLPKPAKVEFYTALNLHGGNIKVLLLSEFMTLTAILKGQMTQVFWSCLHFNANTSDDVSLI
jgi:hypothetical protein